jgi:hypothetical protein
VARIRETRGLHRVLVGKLEGKRTLGRPSTRWEENINMNLEETGWEGVDSNDLTQDRDRCRGCYEHGNKPSGSIKCWEFLEYRTKY